MLSIPFDVTRTVPIRSTKDHLTAVLGDFSLWPQWSPWICIEPDCDFKVDGAPGKVGHKQTWSGQRIGSGQMTLTNRSANKLEFDLQIFSPWKSKSQILFQLDPSEDSIELKWSMAGQLPFFMFPFKKTMTEFVGSDYERGLFMLKEYIEQGHVLSKTMVKDSIQAQPGFFYLGQRKQCATKDIGPVMSQHFTELDQLRRSGDIPKPIHAFAIYHKYGIVDKSCDYTAGFIYKDKPSSTQDLEWGEVLSHKAIQVDHLGRYTHLGNAWAAAFSHQRMKKARPDKKAPMYEIYRTRPDNVNESQVHTEIYLPVK